MDDHKEIEELQGKLQDALAKLTRLGPHVGAARTVKKFNDDRCKNALAIEEAKSIKSGDPVTAAKSLGRSSPIYLEKLKGYESEYKDAEATLVEWEITMTKIDSYRSMLALLRETMHAGIAGGGF